MKQLTVNIVERLYIILMLMICLIPLVGLVWYKAPAVNVEKRTRQPLPQPISEGRPNITYFQDLGKYFEEHFAYRDYIVAMDSQVMAKAFHTSAVDTIVLGKNDWLYYQDSVSDFQRSNTLEERGAIALAHNISLIQRKVEDNGRKFAFTVAPNKNSLYGENMPDNLKHRVGKLRNIEVAQPMFQEYGIKYIDLFEAIGSREEVLYRRQDSHWNGQGAVAAYNTIMDFMKKKHHPVYEDGRWKKSKTKRGDLATSLYGVFADPEWDMEENEKDLYTFASDVDYWEEAPLVETENKSARGSLYMYRDSFGITLGPLMANAYKKAYFSGETIYHLDRALENYESTSLIIEIVERNLRHFVDFDPTNISAGAPPIMSFRVKNLEKNKNQKKMKEISAKPKTALCDLQRDYTMVYGTLNTMEVPKDARVLVELSNGEKRRVYEAFITVDPATNKDYGFLVYLPNSVMEQYQDISVKMRI